MQQHAVPQNISSFEFKLIGELTLKQFAFLGSGIIIAYLIYISILPPFFKWPLVVLFGIGGGAFALIPIEERPLHQWFISFFRAIFSPTQRIWRKHPQLPDFLLPAHQFVNRIATYQPSGQTRFQLEQYLARLPTTKSQLDVQEEKFIQTLPWDTMAAVLPIQPQTPIESGQIMPITVPTAPFYQPSPGREQAGTIAIAPIPAPPAVSTKKPEPIFELPGLSTRQQPETIVPPVATPPVAIPKKEQVLPIASEINFGSQPIIAIHLPDEKTRFIPEIGHIRVRKLHSTEPLAEVSLPIRGEKRFEISAAFQKRLAPIKSGLEPAMSNDKTTDQPPASRTTAFVKTAPAPVAHISPQLNMPPPQPNLAAAPENMNVSETTKKISQLNQDNQRLIRQIQDINKQLADAKDKGDGAYVSSLRTALNQARQEKEAAANQITQLQTMLVSIAAQTGQSIYIPRGRGRTPSVIKQADQLHAAQTSTPQRPKIPNIVAGLVQDANGSSLENVIIVIYDENKTPVRAFRTNKLGQFAISTPLANGNYQIEFEKEGHNFAILNIQMNGNIVEPITIKGKG